MNKNKRYLLVGTILLILFVSISVVTFRKSRDYISEGYLTSEGNAAPNFALLVSNNIKLTNEQVEKLKKYCYEELIASEENNNLCLK